MRRHLLAAAALAGAAASASPAVAQAPQKVSKSGPASGAGRAGSETGAFVVRLGADTTAVERWTRTTTASGARLEGDVVNRTPIVRVTHYVVDLDAAGRPTRAEVRTRRPDGTPVPNQALGAVYTFRGDSAYAEVQTPDSVARFRAPAPAGTIPSLANSYAMWEVAVGSLRAAKRDSGSIELWGAGAPRSQALPVRFTSPAEAIVTYFGDPVAMHFDPQGRLVHVDGSRSTNKQDVQRVATADIAAIAQRFGARPAAGQPSPRDTTRATLGAAQLLVDYGRPFKRGRTVWGGTLVPYDAIWRTGANAATTFVTSADLVIGGQPVPAGTYTLYTWPTAQGYQLVINKQTKQWGTEYKQEMDLVRVPLTATTLSAPVEQFTIAVEPSGANAGTLALRWDTLQLSTPITVK
ncbi:MAG: DUF2911 domain-containing protein [Gemmatirosa sp.]